MLPEIHRTIDNALVNLVKSKLAKVASTNEYNDLDNLPSKLSQFENDEGYVKDISTIPESTIIELWDLDSDSDPESIHIPNVPITNPEIEDAWNIDGDDDGSGSGDGSHDTITPISQKEIEEAWGLNDPDGI